MHLFPPQTVFSPCAVCSSSVVVIGRDWTLTMTPADLGQTATVMKKKQNLPSFLFHPLGPASRSVISSLISSILRATPKPSALFLSVIIPMNKHKLYLSIITNLLSFYVSVSMHYRTSGFLFANYGLTLLVTNNSGSDDNCLVNDAVFAGK